MSQTAARRRPVPHEITMMAFTEEGGKLSVFDIITTSYHHASYFARRWVRDGEVKAIAAAAPGTPWSEFNPRRLERAARHPANVLFRALFGQVR